MMFFDKSTYGDFLKSAEGIATNILAARLQSLEDNKLILKLEHPDSRAKVLYQLTKKAIDLLPIIVELYLWAEKHLDIPADLKALLKEAKKEKDKFIKTKTQQLIKQIAG